jgi:hypothetical protein
MAWPDFNFNLDLEEMKQPSVYSDDREEDISPEELDGQADEGYEQN